MSRSTGHGENRTTIIRHLDRAGVARRGGKRVRGARTDMSRSCAHAATRSLSFVARWRTAAPDSGWLFQHGRADVGTKEYMFPRSRPLTQRSGQTRTTPSPSPRVQRTEIHCHLRRMSPDDASSPTRPPTFYQTDRDDTLVCRRQFAGYATSVTSPGATYREPRSISPRRIYRRPAPARCTSGPRPLRAGPPRGRRG